MAEKKQKSYEVMIKEIEGLLLQLDNKELPLEEAIKTYKNGVELINACNKRLDIAEKDLKVIEDKEI